MAKQNTLTERVFLPADAGVLNLIINFACGMVDVETTDGSLPEEPQGWVVRNLIDQGVLGWYDTDGPMSGWWLISAFMELNRYGMPKSAFCRTQATASGGITRRIEYDPNRAGMRIIRANALQIPPRLVMVKYARQIEQCERLLWGNMRASLRSQIIGAPKEQVETVRGILENANDGEASVIEQTIADTLTSIDISVPFNGNAIHQLLTELYSDAFRRFGGVTPPQYKSERVQSAEIAAQVAEAIDNVYLMIDTFNDDCKRYGVPRRMVYRGYGATFDKDDDPKPDNGEETDYNPEEGVPT